MAADRLITAAAGDLGGYFELETALTLEVADAGITSADIAAGRVPLRITDKVRRLLRYEAELHDLGLFFSVWNVPIWQRQEQVNHGR